MSELDDSEIGERLGNIIVALVDVIAEIDGVERETVLETLFTEWWAKRVTNGEER